MTRTNTPLSGRGVCPHCKAVLNTAVDSAGNTHLVHGLTGVLGYQLGRTSERAVIVQYSSRRLIHGWRCSLDTVGCRQGWRIHECPAKAGAKGAAGTPTSEVA